MSAKNRNSALILLMVIAVASGCAQGDTDEGVTIEQEAGVNIESFTATPSEIYEGQPVTLDLQLNNKGGSEARDVEAKLYNVAFEGTRSWSIQSGAQEMEYNNLRSANPDTETPSRSVSQVWTLEAPEIDGDRRIPYNFNTRVFYKYKTNSVTDITVMSGQQFRNSDEAKERPTLDNSGGPIQMEVRTRSPVVFYEGADDTTSNFCVIVKNVGDGTPFVSSADYSDAASSENERKVEVSVQSSGTQVSFDEESKTVDIIGKEGQACFTMNAESISGSEIQQRVPITIDADYGYYVDSSESLTVRGRSQ